MEEDIQNYSTTVMFRGTPCIFNIISEKKIKKTTFHLNVGLYKIHEMNCCK